MKKFIFFCLALSKTIPFTWALEKSPGPIPSFPKSVQEATKDVLKNGSTISSFELRNHLGENKKLADFLKQGPVVLSFYRGGWCPFCNNELKDLREISERVRALGGQILALSPEASHKLRQTQEHHKLPFELLSDAGNKVARQFGVAFELDAKTSKTYRERLIVDLKKWNANGDEVLPIPATFLIDSNYKIVYSFVEPDYKKRVNKDILLNQLQKLSQKPSSKGAGNYFVKIKGMTCEGCAEGINRLLMKDKRISASSVTFNQGGGLVETSPEKINPATLTKLIEDMGYGVEAIESRP